MDSRKQEIGYQCPWESPAWDMEPGTAQCHHLRVPPTVLTSCHALAQEPIMAPTVSKKKFGFFGLAFKA